MRILIFNWRDIKNPKSGGAEIVTMEHAKAWIKAGHTVTWFTSNFKKGKRKEIINGVEIKRIGNFISVYFFAPFFYLFGGRKFDIVIDQIHGLPFFTPIYVRKPKIAFIHEVADEIWDYMFPFPLNILGRIIEPFYFRLYKNIPFWVPSESTIKDLLRHGIRRDICVKILCGISNPTLTKLPNKEKIPTFIFVSRLVKMKGIEEVINAFSIIKEEQSESQLWIVGGGDMKYRKFLEAKIRELEIGRNVKFFGYVSDQLKLKLMRKSHVLLHASIKEGWGLVIIEAASQATPSVVYNVAGLRESVINGKTGIVISQNSPEHLANATINLLKDKKTYEFFQKKCLERSNSLAWEKYTKQSLNLLKKVSRG